MMLDMGKNKDMLLRIAGLARAIRCCQQEAAFCEDLTFTRFIILETVGEKQPPRLSDLHEILGADGGDAASRSLLPNGYIAGRTGGNFGLGGVYPG